MSILVAFVHSLYDVLWLRANKQAPGKAWSYFFIFIWALSILSLASVAMDLPRVIASAKQAVAGLPDFDARITGGKLTVTKVVQPFYLINDQNFVFAVNTTATTSQSVKDYIKDPEQNGVLITSDRIELYQAATAQSRINYFDTTPDTQFNKQSLTGIFNKLIAPWLIAIMALIALVGLFIGLAIYKLVSLLIVVLIVLFISIIAKKGWNFKQLFTVGLYSLTLPTVITFVLTLFSLNFAYLHFLLLLAFMLAVVFTKEEGEVKGEKA